MNTLVDVLQFLWNLADDYIFFTLSFMFAMGICSHIIYFVRRFL